MEAELNLIRNTWDTQLRVMATVRSRRYEEMRLLLNKLWAMWWLNVHIEPKGTDVQACRIRS